MHLYFLHLLVILIVENPNIKKKSMLKSGKVNHSYLRVQITKGLFWALIVFGVVISPAKQATAQSNIPEWYLNPPEIDGKLVATGVGESNYEALLNLLKDVIVKMSSRSVTERRDTDDDSGRFLLSYSQYSNAQLGNIRVEDYSMLEGVEGEDSQVFTYMTRADFRLGSQYFRIEINQTEFDLASNIKLRTDLRLSSDGLGFQDMLDELSRIGFEVELVYQDQDFFVKGVINENKLEEIKGISKP
ncbi:MAG: LPP20 family lipoprotein [Balneolales bacterium]|nr:LPP20 family lipoprotein [Balneolales bacterium]